MALGEEVGDHVAAGFARAAGEDDAFACCGGCHCESEDVVEMEVCVWWIKEENLG